MRKNEHQHIILPLPGVDYNFTIIINYINNKEFLFFIYYYKIIERDINHYIFLYFLHLHGFYIYTFTKTNREISARER